MIEQYFFVGRAGHTGFGAYWPLFDEEPSNAGTGFARFYGRSDTGRTYEKRGATARSFAFEQQANTFTLLNRFKDVELDDQDASPIAARRLRTIDGLIRAADTSNVEGRYISKLSVEAIATGDLPSGIPATKIGGGGVDDTEFGYLDGLTGNVQSQLDNLAQGLKWKQSARVATTANVDLANALENGDSIDGITLATGDRVLVKNQTAPAENGIYIVPASGAAARAGDANTALELEAATIGVEEGTAGADTIWTQTADNFTLGTDPVTWTKIQTLTDLVAGGGLTKSGATIDVGAGDGIQVDADSVTIKLDGTTLVKSGSGLKFRDVSATSRILGRKTAGAGEVEELTSSDLIALIGGWTPVKKTSDETITSDSTLSADAALKVPMLANTVYHIRGRIFFNTTANADFKWRHSGPAAPTMVRLFRSDFVPGGSFTTRLDTAYSSADIVVGSTTTEGYIQIDAIIKNGANAGDFEFQWAQNSGSTDQTTVLAGSYLEYTTF